MPMAGHKGYGLAVMVEALCALTSGAGMLGDILSWGLADPAKHTGHSHAFVAIDVAAMAPLQEFRKRVDELIRRIRSAPKAQGSDRIWLPGEIEAEKMKAALVHGVALPKDVRASLKGLAEDLGMTAEWMEEGELGSAK